LLVNRRRACGNCAKRQQAFCKRLWKNFPGFSTAVAVSIRLPSSFFFGSFFFLPSSIPAWHRLARSPHDWRDKLAYGGREVLRAAPPRHTGLTCDDHSALSAFDPDARRPAPCIVPC